MKLTEEKRSVGRPRKYSSVEESNAAAAERQRQRRAEKKKKIDERDITPEMLEQARVALQEKLDTRRKQQVELKEPRKSTILNVDPDLAQRCGEFTEVAQGMQYARNILRGITPSNKWVRLACERHEKDMRRSGTDEFPYVLDMKKANRVIKILQLFREIKGPNAGRLFRLEPWQKFIMMCAFGWVHMHTEARRFRQVIMFCPRGNGKSSMMAPVGLYLTALDNEGGAEVYSAAVTREQARIVFGASQVMAERCPEFREKFSVMVNAHTIVQTRSASSFRPLSRDAGSLDGLNVHGAILDEIAQHKTREVYDVLVTAMGKRTQPMMIAISTAGSNQSGIGFEQWRYVQNILNGVNEDESCFGILYAADDEDDWADEKTWEKANPNWGVSVMPDAIRSLAKRASQVASQQNAFKQKHLNLWTNADVAWVDPRKWIALGDPDLVRDAFASEPVVIGLDLASKVDICAKILLFSREHEDGQRHYYVFLDSYLPQSAVIESRNASYAGWEIDGWIQTTGLETTDFEIISKSIRDDDGSRFEIKDVAYDPWQAMQMAQQMEADCIPCIEFRATVQNFSAPMKQVEALIMEGRIHHDGNPVLAWMMSNVVCHLDAKDNVYPRKERPENKIDGVVALIMAMGRMMQIENQEFDAGSLLI